jgi:hypothetical protein
MDRLYMASDLVFILDENPETQFKELFERCCKFDIERRPEKYFWMLFLPGLKQVMDKLFRECAVIKPAWINLNCIVRFLFHAMKAASTSGLTSPAKRGLLPALFI